jgi:hypothetical protein
MPITRLAIINSVKSYAETSDSSKSYDSGVTRSSARAIGAKPVNTTRRYATRRGKSVKTEEIYTDKTVTDGIMTVITIMIMTDF